MNPSYSMPRVLGWLLGGLSLVTLAQLLISLRLHSSIQYLIISYRIVVYQVFDFLIGWIHLSWFHVSDIEQHFIIILAICQSALLNANKKYANSILFFVISIVVFLLLDVIIFGFVPDSFVITPLFVVILMLLLPFYLERQGDIRLEGYSSNLIGITVFFFAIILVNRVLTIV